MSELWELSAQNLHEQFVNHQVTAEAIVQAHLAHIDKVDGTIGAFLHIDPKASLSEARAQDTWTVNERREKVLSGVPVALKDNIVTRDMPSTAGSKILQGFVSPYDATVTLKLRHAGAIIVGKTNLDEFAMGSSTEHSAYHVTRNPWDTARVPGGSSGGSAAAVASRMVPVALGSDTGGSIRQPAAYCGIIGLKPTYGRVSRYGLIAYASSLDQIGPLTRSVADANVVYGVISGQDPRDSTSISATDLAAEQKPLRIGLPKEYFEDGMNQGIRDRMNHAVEGLRQLGHEMVEISLPHTRYAISTYYLIAPAEASSNLSRYDGVRYGMRADGQDLVSMYEETRDEGLGAEVKRRILLGTHALSAGYYDAFYLTAQKVRTRIREDFKKAFAVVDLIVTPTTPDVPFLIGERDDDPIKMYLGDIYTVTANLAGIPGLSMPIGLVNGLPVGLQWLGPPLAEKRLLHAASQLENHLGDIMPWPRGTLYNA